MEGTIDLVIYFLSLQGEGQQDLNLYFAEETQHGADIKQKTPKPQLDTTKYARIDSGKCFE